MVPKSWVERIFERMRSLFPKDWCRGMTESEKAAMAEEWKDGLNGIPGITGEKIGKAIDYCRDHLKFAPAFSEFRDSYLHANTDPRQFFVVTPDTAPKNGDPDRVRQIIVGIAERMNSNRPRRWIRPTPEYRAALKEADRIGKSRYIVDLEFLEQTGWTIHHEQEFLQHVRVISFGTPWRFFEYGHAPAEFQPPPPPPPREVSVIYRGAD